MEYQKKIFFQTIHQINHPYQFRTKNWTKVNYDLRGKYYINSQCNYGDAYIFVKRIIAITGDREDDAIR